MRTCLDGFLANERQAADAVEARRRRVLESLDFASADAELARRTAAGDLDPDAWFRAEWIRSLFSSAVDELARAVRRDVARDAPSRCSSVTTSTDPMSPHAPRTRRSRGNSTCLRAPT